MHRLGREKELKAIRALATKVNLTALDKVCNAGDMSYLVLRRRLEGARGAGQALRPAHRKSKRTG
jgi:hypothetical protein